MTAPAATEPTRRGDEYLAWLPAALLVGFYTVFLFNHALNIPQLDDYSNLLKFLVDFLDAGSWADKRALLFSSNHTEHLTLLNRLLVLLQYSLTGELNLRQLIFVGNGFTALTFLLFLSQLPKDARDAFHVTLGALLLFQPFGWYNGTWAMAALSNLGVWPLGFAALIAANHGTLSWRRLSVAFVFGLFACLTQGNGMVAFLLAPLALAFRLRHRGATLALAAWALAALALYLGVLANDDPLVQARMQHSLKFALLAPLKAGLFHLVLVGRFFSDQVVVAALLGLGGTVYSVLCLWDLVRGRATTSQLFILYVMGSLLLVTLLRAGMTFGDLDISHRYWFYSQLFWFCVILDSLARFRWHQHFAPWARWSLLPLAIGLCLSRFAIAHSEISLMNRDRIQGQEAWLVSGHPLSNRHLFLAVPAADELERAMSRGIYNPYKNHRSYVEPRPDVACNLEDVQPARGVVEIGTNPGAYLSRLSGWAQPPGGIGSPSELLLCAEGKAFRLPWLWTEYYFGPAQVEWAEGSVFNFYYLFQPIDADLRHALLIMRSGARFRIEARLLSQAVMGGGEGVQPAGEAAAADRAEPITPP